MIVFPCNGSSGSLTRRWLDTKTFIKLIYDRFLLFLVMLRMLHTVSLVVNILICGYEIYHASVDLSVFQCWIEKFLGCMNYETKLDI